MNNNNILKALGAIELAYSAGMTRRTGLNLDSRLRGILSRLRSDLTDKALAPAKDPCSKAVGKDYDKLIKDEFNKLQEVKNEISTLLDFIEATITTK